MLQAEDLRFELGFGRRARFEDLSSDVVAKAQSLVAAVSTGSSPLLIFAGHGTKTAPLRAAVAEAVPGAVVANFGEAAELACVGAARQAALLAFGADPETAAPAERRGKGLA